MGHFTIPTDDFTRVINFSGGRSSGFMLHEILQAHGGLLPANVAVIFCNTGKERIETLDFVEACAVHWHVPIIWLEFTYRARARGGGRDPKYLHKVVNHTTAARNGEPFAELIAARRMLPNAVMRHCTSELKVLTIERYITRELGWNKRRTKNVLGIRYDEPRRWQKAILGECLTEYPLVRAQVTRRMVNEFWQGQAFDLDMHSAFSNCDGCFLKGEGSLTHLFRAHPDLANWWIEMEEKSLAWGHGREATFNKAWTYAELKARAMNEPELLPPVEEPTDNCFCTD